MLDDKTKALIIKYLRKAWLYSPARRQVIKAAETGEKTKEGEKLYYCIVGPHKVQKVYVDHLVPFVLLTGFDSWDALIERLFNVENERCICKIHHAEKTKLEAKFRAKNRARKPK
jgi:hypothetical protein